MNEILIGGEKQKHKKLIWTYKAN